MKEKVWYGGIQQALLCYDEMINICNISHIFTLYTEELIFFAIHSGL